jgi:DNA helicase-2/ATP-dependent DNA helicase PcrA
LDYSSILREAVAELKCNVGLRERLAARIRYVIVDEYQDVNPVQETVVEELHRLGAGICVVGDDDQTIYQWRGSDVRNILSFEERYPGVTQVRLEENFRSSEGVVAVAREFIRQVVRRLPKEMKTTGAQEYEPGDITALPFDAPEDEARHMARTCQILRGVTIRENGGDRGVSWSDMAILLRSVRRDGGAIMAALDEAGVPYVITGMDNLFQTHEAEAARQLFYFLADEIDEGTLRTAWRAADVGVATDALERAVAAAVRAREEMKKADVGQFKVYNLQRQFIAFLENAGLREERVPGGRGEVVFYNLGKFSQVISDFESIHFHSSPVEKYTTFAGFLRHHAENAYPEGWQDNAFVSPDAVRIMTVHQQGAAVAGRLHPAGRAQSISVPRWWRAHCLAPYPGGSIRQRRPIPGRLGGRAPLVLRGGDARAEIPAHELGAASGQPDGPCPVGFLQRSARVEVREAPLARLRRAQTARAAAEVVSGQRHALVL